MALRLSGRLMVIQNACPRFSSTTAELSVIVLLAVTLFDRVLDRLRSSRRSCPVVTCSASTTSTAEMMPETVATCTCSIFMASSVMIGWPASTRSPGLTSTATTRPFIAARTLPSLPSGAARAGRGSGSNRVPNAHCHDAGRTGDRRRGRSLPIPIKPSTRKRMLSQPNRRYRNGDRGRRSRRHNRRRVHERSRVPGSAHRGRTAAEAERWRQGCGPSAMAAHEGR